MTAVPDDLAHAHPHTHASLHGAEAGNAVEPALAALRTRGERVTAGRRAVLEVLAGTPDYLSADEILAALGSPGTHRATVYRTLDVLTELGIITHMHSDTGAGVYHFGGGSAGDDHLHAHCRRCRGVTVLPGDALAAASRALFDETGFSLDAGRSTLVGVCAECAESGGL